MSIGYHVLKNLSSSIIIEHFKVSSQGVAESQGLISKWTDTRSKNSGFNSVFMDSDLQNIWAADGYYLYCLRAGGLDQEVIDLQMNKIDIHFSHDKYHIFVRGSGVGESICSIIPKKCYDGDAMFNIQFDNSGYHIQSSTINDEIGPFFDDSEDFKINWLDSYALKYSSNHQHPHAPHIPYLYYNDQYLVWDFAHGLRWINAEIKDSRNIFLSAAEEYKRIMEERIQLPGNNEIIPGDGYGFSNDACSFGNWVRGITPIDNETPQPRYPKPMAQKNLEKKIQDDISYIQGFLSEKYPNFRNN